MKITMEAAEAFGYCDRCHDIEAEGRGITFSRFEARPYQAAVESAA